MQSVRMECTFVALHPQPGDRPPNQPGADRGKTRRSRAVIGRGSDNFVQPATRKTAAQGSINIAMPSGSYICRGGPMWFGQTVDAPLQQGEGGKRIGHDVLIMFYHQRPDKAALIASNITAAALQLFGSDPTNAPASDGR